MVSRHRFRLILTLLLVVGLVAVSGGAAFAGNARERPFHSSVESDFEVVGECPSGAPLSSISGTGVASHLGSLTIEGSACQGEPGFVTWTAANGDTIGITFVTILLAEPGEDGSAPFTMQVLGVSGTGRFANVQFGEGQGLSGTIWFNPDGSGHLEGTSDGTIIYDASDRGN